MAGGMGRTLSDSVFALEFAPRPFGSAATRLRSSANIAAGAAADRVLVAWAVGYDSTPAVYSEAAMRMCAVPLRNQTDCGPRELSAHSCAMLGCCSQPVEPKCFASFQNGTVPTLRLGLTGILLDSENGTIIMLI